MGYDACCIMVRYMHDKRVLGEEELVLLCGVVLLCITKFFLVA